MHRNKIMLASVVSSFVWLAATVVLGGMAYPDYSHFSQFISELGATGAPYASMVNYLGFVPTEILMMAFIYCVALNLPRNKLAMLGLLFLILYALGLIIAAIYSCDFECRPIQASMSHNLHMAFGTAAYLFAVIGIILLSVESKKWPDSKVIRLAGWAISITALVLLFNLDPDSSAVGLIQRITEFLLYLWFFMLAIYLYKPRFDKNLP